MKTIHEKLKEIEEILEKNNLEKNIGLLLMEHVHKYSNRTAFFLHLNEECQNEELIDNYLKEVLKGSPIQYVLQEAWFLNRSFYVDKRVLIPRMETEELALMAYEVIDNFPTPIVFDLCTGSGCLAISIALEFPMAQVIASDISSMALEVTRINQKRLQVNNISLLLSDLFLSYPQGTKADVIVTNPPYVEKNDEIDPLVLRNEPSLALFPPSGDGLEMYKRIFKALPYYLNNNGFLLAEFGYQQKKPLEKLVKKMLSKSQITFYQDMNGKDRFFVLQYHE